MRSTVVISLLGTTLDAAYGDRWQRWRPNVDLCRHDDFIVDRLELLFQEKWRRLADETAADVAQVSPETELVPRVVDLGDPWDFESVFAALLDFAQAYPFRPDDEDYLIHITTGTHVAQICLFLLTESRHLPGRLLQTSPPPARHRGGPGHLRTIDLDLSKYDLLATRFHREREASLSALKSGIATRSAAFNHLIERIERVALASRSPMLLTGPTGAGKTRLARRVFDLKRARNQVAGAFVELNCATLRGDGAMSALFGHVRGAFTGAVGARDGALKSADGGLLFLDEVGELGLDEQAMLLRALEDRRFLPVGSDREVASDFQLIAGTNRDLRARVREGAFREDLLARIDVWTFALPGLRERGEDIEPNLDYELDRWTQRSGRRVTLNREARRRFLEFAVDERSLWTGNFRDFAAAVERMATLATDGRVAVADVDEEIARLRGAWAAVAAPEARTADAPPVRSDSHVSAAPTAGGRDLELLGAYFSPEAIDALDRFDRAQLADVIRVCLGAPSLSEAGRRLFAASRKRKRSSNDADRLRKYLARFDLSWQRIHPD
ncbi:MAG: RNA repair transcriptional activator RtcR [Nannocystaceae bacterium]